MAIRRLDKSFEPNKRELNYLNKSFPQWRQSLVDYAKVYYPTSYTDFNETSPGMMFIEMMAYVGDVLGYYLDTQFRENLLQYAEESENIISIAQALGFKPRPSTAAYTFADFYQLCPSKGASFDYNIDERFLIRMAPGTIVASEQYSVQFRTVSEVDFKDPLDREITIYSVDGSNKPLMYLVKKKAKVVAGIIETFTAIFEDPKKFSVVKLPDDNVLEVISVTDSAGHVWYEVDYLAQDAIFDARDNVTPTATSDQSLPPTYVMKIRKTSRRFVTRYNNKFLMELHFGSGILDDSDALINLEPSKIASSEYETNVGSTSLDPSDFLSSNSYGLAPGNLSMTIKYSVGGGVQTNVPANSLNRLVTVTVLNDKNTFNPSEQLLFNDVVTSLAVNNSEPATGGKDSDSIEEIRQNALAFFNAQNRAVTAEDYAVRCMAMPPKYGSPAKVFVARDDQINAILRNNSQLAPNGGTFVNDDIGRGAVNLYVLGYDFNKKLVALNNQVKENMKTYLETYRIMTDEIRILDAFPVNIGVNFKITVFKNNNMNEVLARCIDAVRNFFDIDKWQINQPIIVNDLYIEIASVEGVQSISSLEIVNKYKYKDGDKYEEYIYDINAATREGIIFPSLDPSIFELRYPETDIVGNAQQ